MAACKHMSLVQNGDRSLAVNGVKSEWVPVLQGVPHGIVLKPLLSSWYINDITEDIDSE